MFKAIKSILPVVKADDLVDPQAELRVLHFPHKNPPN